MVEGLKRNPRLKDEDEEEGFNKGMLRVAPRGTRDATGVKPYILDNILIQVSNTIVKNFIMKSGTSKCR